MSISLPTLPLWTQKHQPPLEWLIKQGPFKRQKSGLVLQGGCVCSQTVCPCLQQTPDEWKSVSRLQSQPRPSGSWKTSVTEGGVWRDAKEFRVCLLMSSKSIPDSHNRKLTLKLVTTMHQLNRCLGRWTNLNPFVLPFNGCHRKHECISVPLQRKHRLWI